MRYLNNKKGILPVMVLGVMLFIGCETVTSVDEISEISQQSVDATMARSSQWVTKVSGGGKNVAENGVIEWISLNATTDADGNTSGMYEYGNTIPNQEWRYHGSIECLAVSEDGTKAVAIGPVTLTQGPESPALGQLVAFYIGDNGNGNKQDTGFAVFSNSLNCEARLANFVVGPRVTSGNYNIATR